MYTNKKAVGARYFQTVLAYIFKPTSPLFPSYMQTVWRCLSNTDCMEMFKQPSVKLGFNFWLKVYRTEGICGTPAKNHYSNWNEHEQGCFFGGEFVSTDTTGYHQSSNKNLRMLVNFHLSHFLFSFFLFAIMRDHWLIFGASIRKLLCLFTLLSVSTLRLQWRGRQGSFW